MRTTARKPLWQIVERPPVAVSPQTSLTFIINWLTAGQVSLVPFVPSIYDIGAHFCNGRW